MTVQEAAEALGLKTPSGVYERLADERLTGRKVRRGNTTRWQIHSDSVAAERERMEQDAEPPDPYRPVFIRLPDERVPFDYDERRAFIRRLREEAYAAQEP